MRRLSLALLALLAALVVGCASEPTEELSADTVPPPEGQAKMDLGGGSAKPDEAPAKSPNQPAAAPAPEVATAED